MDTEQWRRSSDLEQAGSGAEKRSDWRVQPAWLPVIIWVGSARGDHKCPQGISNPLQVPEATRLAVIPNQRGTFPPPASAWPALTPGLRALLLWGRF